MSLNTKSVCLIPAYTMINVSSFKSCIFMVLYTFVSLSDKLAPIVKTDMIDEKTSIVLTLLSDKENTKLSYQDMHKKIESMLSWNDFLNVFTSLHRNEFIDNQNNLTELAVNKLTEYNNAVDKNIQEQKIISSDKKLERTKTKLEIVDKILLIIGFVFSASLNVYQFYNTNTKNIELKRKEMTIDSLTQVVSELTIQNTKSIGKDTLLTRHNDTTLY